MASQPLDYWKRVAELFADRATTQAGQNFRTFIASIEEDEMHNPYDRRGRPDTRGDIHAMTNLGFPSEPHDPDAELTVMDLNMIARHAFQRGQRSQVDRQVEEKRLACLRAWDEGSRAGEHLARGRLLVAMDEQFGERIRGLIDMTGETLGESDVAKPALRHAIEALRNCLGDLVEAHHHEFEEPKRDPRGPLFEDRGPLGSGVRS